MCLEHKRHNNCAISLIIYIKCYIEIVLDHFNVLWIYIQTEKLKCEIMLHYRP